MQLTISASGPPKSRNIMRTPSSDDIRRRSKGCLSRTLFLTPISSVNSVKPSSMCTPRVHSFPFQLQAGKGTEMEQKQRGCYKCCSATEASFIRWDKPSREKRTRLNLCGTAVCILVAKYLHDCGLDDVALHIVPSRGQYNHTSKNHVEAHHHPNKGQMLNCALVVTLLFSLLTEGQKYMQVRLTPKNRLDCSATSNMKM